MAKFGVFRRESGCGDPDCCPDWDTDTGMRFDTADEADRAADHMGYTPTGWFFAQEVDE